MHLHVRDEIAARIMVNKSWSVVQETTRALLTRNALDHTSSGIAFPFLDASKLLATFPFAFRRFAKSHRQKYKTRNRIVEQSFFRNTVLHHLGDSGIRIHKSTYGADVNDMASCKSLQFFHL